MGVIPAGVGFEEFVGRLHPLLLHFPLALLMVAAGVEVVRYMCGRREEPSQAGTVCLWVGLVTGVLAVWAGWELAEFEGESGTLVGLHRWTAVAAMAVAAAAAGAWIMRRTRGRDWTGAHVSLLLVAAVLVGISGHFGAEMKWGDDWLTRPSASEPPPVAAPTGTVGWADVSPILAAHCEKCHGPKRQKAGLQLVPWKAIFAADSAEWVVAPGDPAGSLLHTAITLPASEEGAMPPEDKAEPLTSGQIDLLSRWIQDGALGPDGAIPPAAGQAGPPEAPPADPPAETPQKPDAAAAAGAGL
ncbi:MAG: c-type cytochrome domain-containing protein [Phycisphaerales bacterium]|jgi:uncharacterized membrane protein|nr:c-type cytochrome domain-containing protein [Phycisphaerales bacterium]